MDQSAPPDSIPSRHPNDAAHGAIIQRDYPEAFHHCFGCGAENRQGLRLGSWQEGDEVVTRWTPPEHLVGPQRALHGGITALLIDEVGSAAAFIEAHRRRGTRAGQDAAPFFVTANLSVDYLAPIPIDGAVEIRARAASTERPNARKIPIECTISCAGQVAARGRVLFIITDAARYAEG